MLAARELPLIEDDLYGDLYFGPSRPRAAKSFDRRGLVLYCGSFSKTLAPGWRTGWVAPGRFRDRVSLLKFAQTVATASLQQLAFAEFPRRRVLRPAPALAAQAVGATMRSMGDAVATHFPDGTRATRPEGGGVLWVELPTGSRPRAAPAGPGRRDCDRAGAHLLGPARLRELHPAQLWPFLVAPDRGGRRDARTDRRRDPRRPSPAWCSQSPARAHA